MSLRTVAKTLAAEALCRTGADRLCAGGTPAALVLGYHRVIADGSGPGPSVPAMAVSTSMLERHLQWVGRRFRFVSLDELGQAVERGMPPGAPLAAVTFDDGYREVYEHAFPLLQRLGIPGAVFVVTDLVGGRRLLPHDELYLLLARAMAEPAADRVRLDRTLRRFGLRVTGLDAPATTRAQVFSTLRHALATLPAAGLAQLVRALEQAVGPAGEPPELGILDWDSVRAMLRGGFTVGSHTCGHVILTGESLDRVRMELGASRRRLEYELGAPVQHLAYPDGGFDRDVAEAAAEAGYRFAYTTCQHRDSRHPLLTIPRRLLWEDSCRDAFGRFSPRVLRCQVAGVFDRMDGCRGDRHVSRRSEARPA